MIMRPRQQMFLLTATLASFQISGNSKCVTALRTLPQVVVTPPQSSSNNSLLLATSISRGGASSSSSSSAKKKKKKKKKTTEKETATAADGKAKKAIDNAMKEKDAAEALGDAIRDRADVLREEDPLLQSIDWSVSSVGSALGASDHRIRMLQERDAGGGVEAAPMSVLANYFLKSHGGAHALQCVCSFLATICGLAAIVLHKSPTWGFVLLQRTMLFAMVKHVSGLLASASIAAKAIPKIGLSQARQWMEQIAMDPVSQYVFYTALILLWLPAKERLDSCWWWNVATIPPLLVGPILIREIISNMLVVSDILVLWSMSGEDSTSSTFIGTILKTSQSTINAVMSLLVSPEIWRSADPAQRQAILAKLVSQISLILEFGVGSLLLIDMAIGFVQTAFFSGPNRPPFRESLTRLLCVRLYLHFLWVRRRRLQKVALKLRGGAAKLPFWFLDVIYDPGKSMGIGMGGKNDDDPSSYTWKDFIWTALGTSDK